MPETVRLLLTVLGLGAIMGLIVVGAARIAGRPATLGIWLGGLFWGSMATGMIMAGCGSGYAFEILSNTGLVVAVLGLVALPIALTWQAVSHYWRWFLTQLFMLLNIGPIIFAGLLAVLCQFT